MSTDVEQVRRTYPAASSSTPFQQVMQTLDIPTATHRNPRVLIRGDIRLCVSEAYATLKPIRGSYRLEMEDMQEPLQVIWITEERVLGHSVHDIDMEFDLRGARAGETRTHLLTAHVTESGGQGSIVQSSVFVQISVT